MGQGLKKADELAAPQPAPSASELFLSMPPGQASTEISEELPMPPRTIAEEFLRDQAIEATRIPALWEQGPALYAGQLVMMKPAGAGASAEISDEDCSWIYGEAATGGMDVHVAGTTSPTCGLVGSRLPASRMTAGPCHFKPQDRD